MFARPIEYYLNRFHNKQEQMWIAYKAGLDLVCDWGRRSGKSALISEILVEDIETYGRDVLYIAITQVQARDILWDKLQEILQYNNKWHFNETRLEIKHIPSKATISLKGADIGKDRLRGSAKRIIALDEFAFFKDPTIVKDVLVPMLADYNGQMIYCSTPKGKNHFYKLKQKALKKEQKYFTTHCTVFENPFLNPEGRDKLLEEYTGTDDPLYRQEILAEYIDFQGLVFALPQDTYIEPRWDHGDLTNSYHWRGIDHGFSPDPTACVWIAYNERKGYFQLYSEYRKSELLIHKHAQVINAQESFSFLESYSDIDPQLIAEYEAVGLKTIPAHKYDKESRLLYIVNLLKTGKLKIAKECTELLSEIQTYEWKQDHNDDLIDAMRMAVTNLDVPINNYRSYQQAQEDKYDYEKFNHGQVFDD